MNSWSTGEFQGSATVLFNGRLSKSIECTIQRMNPNVNTGLWLIMMYQYWLIDWNERTTLVWDLGGGGCVHV